MSEGIMGILFVFYTITAWIVFHKIFTVVYFGGVTVNLIKELFGAAIVGGILTALTLYLWWLSALIIIGAGLGVAGKFDNPQARKVVISAFVFMAIVISVVGKDVVKRVKAEQTQERKRVEHRESNYDYARAIHDTEDYSTRTYEDAYDNDKSNNTSYDYAKVTHDAEGYNTRNYGNAYDDNMPNNTPESDFVDSADKVEGRHIDKNSADYLLPNSDVDIITETDLRGMTAQELTYARNEIYARHGYVFKSSELNAYFGSKEWYKANESFTGTLEGIEQKNAAFIAEYQSSRGLEYKPQ